VDRREAEQREGLLLAVRERLGPGEAEIVGGQVRLNGQDAFAAVARPEDPGEPGAVFVWIAGLRWRFRRDLDPDYVAGLIEWRHQRDEREGDEWAGEEYDPA